MSGFTLALALGYPWSSLQLEADLGSRLSPVVQVDSALLRRWTGGAGLGVSVVDQPRVRLQARALLGGTVELSEFPRSGPGGALQLEASFLAGRLRPSLGVGSGHVFFVEQTRIVRASGEELTRSLEHQWVPRIEGGLELGLNEQLALELGLNWIRVGYPELFALPGATLGLAWRPAR